MRGRIKSYPDAHYTFMVGVNKVIGPSSLSVSFAGTLTRARTELNPEYLDLRPRAELNPEYWTPCTPLLQFASKCIRKMPVPIKAVPLTEVNHQNSCEWEKKPSVQHTYKFEPCHRITVLRFICRTTSSRQNVAAAANMNNGFGLKVQFTRQVLIPEQQTSPNALPGSQSSKPVDPVSILDSFSGDAVSSHAVNTVTEAIVDQHQGVERPEVDVDGPPTSTSLNK
ncbi:hypothetical protein F2P81_004297 [Scophthalmus maximus]|uniref:Uncharacterized protein n=1 Tax=Scophthalmus maximus TaxID=52904 RepID=A0A6A4TGR1_SCOMX|nr:hypothetical protein F2P81_004297 [Scophthalmus maximus]